MSKLNKKEIEKSISSWQVRGSTIVQARGGLFVVFAMLAFPQVLFADVTGIETILNTLISIVGGIIPILISCAVLVFFWGLVKFIAHADDEKAVAEGKQLIVWGLVGLFVIVALWGIVGYIQSSLGLDLGVGGGTAPSLPVTIP